MQAAWAINVTRKDLSLSAGSILHTERAAIEPGSLRITTLPRPWRGFLLASFLRRIPRDKGGVSERDRPMRRQRHFERIVAQENNQRDRIASLLETLRRSAVALEASIEDEERRTGKHDPSHFAYPIAARAMAQRHDNLKATIAVLERQIGA
jgi:hypothetical protein